MPQWLSENGYNFCHSYNTFLYRAPRRLRPQVTGRDRRRPGKAGLPKEVHPAIVRAEFAR